MFSGARKGYACSRFGHPAVDGPARTLADREDGAEALAESILSARTIAAVKECLAARAKTLANATSALSPPVKTPAEAAWENEGGHVLPFTGALVGAQPITTHPK